MARFLGIDITKTSLRAAVVRSALRKLDVERYIEIPLTEPPDSAARKPELAEAAQSLLRALHGRPDGIAAAIPGELTSLRALELPAAARKRLAQIVPFELEAMLPYEDEQVVISFQPAVTEAGSSSRSGVSLLAAAVQRKHVERAIDELKVIGLDPTELAAGAAALDGLTQLVPALRTEGPVLLLQIEEDETNVCLLRAGRAVAARTVGEGLRETRDSSQELAHELLRTLAALRAAGHPEPSVVYACGAMAHAEGLLPWLSSHLGVEAKLLELPTQEHQPKPSLGFALATALAARSAVGAPRIDLRTGDLAARHASARLSDYLSLATVCAVMVVVCAMFAIKAEQSVLVDDQGALKAQLEAITKQVLGETLSDPATVKARIENPKRLDPIPRFDAFDALAAVSGSIPQELKHEVKRLRIDSAEDKRQGRLELQGSISSLGDRDTIVSQLEAHGCFRQIELGRTNPIPGQDLINYQLEAVVQCPGEAAPDPKKSGSNKSEEP